MAIKSIHMCALLLFRELSTGELHFAVRKEILKYRGADKSLARPGRKQATATEDFDVHISYL